MTKQKKPTAQPEETLISRIILRMAGTATRRGTVDIRRGEDAYAVELAAAAWNRENGDSRRARSVVSDIDDVDRLADLPLPSRTIVGETIERLAQYKRTHHAGDERRITSLEIDATKQPTLLIEWRDRRGYTGHDRLRQTKPERKAAKRLRREKRVNTVTREAWAMPWPSDPTAMLVRAITAQRSRRDRFTALATTATRAEELTAEAEQAFGAEAPPALALGTWVLNRADVLLSETQHAPAIQNFVKLFGAWNAEYAFPAAGEPPKGNRRLIDRATMIQLAMLDHGIGPNHESWIGTLSETLRRLGVANTWTRYLRRIQAEPPRLLEIIERAPGTRRAWRTRDIITDEPFTVDEWYGHVRHNPRGELWRVRLWPNLRAPKGNWCTAHMPWVLTTDGATRDAVARWQQHLQRVTGSGTEEPGTDAYEAYMRRGTDPEMWLRFGTHRRRDTDRLVIDGLPTEKRMV